MAHEYLTDLNREQRLAVKHGITNESAINLIPLLVIAGAGSGKTKTLANRVAHLVVNGIDPQRILLLTFSRRGSLDMTGRVKRITGAAMGIAEIDLPWAGTFHAVGARILREFADRIGLKPSFTILDRSDAADLMDVVRHDLGMSKKESRFPRKDTRRRYGTNFRGAWNGRLTCATCLANMLRRSSGRMFSIPPTCCWGG